jgi:hypothetical protein
MRQSIRIESCKGHSHILTWDDDSLTTDEVKLLGETLGMYVCGEIIHQSEAVFLLGEMAVAVLVACMRESVA